jgi:hypothetical protein
VAPVLRQQIASGHKLRLLYLLGPQLREFDGDAAQEEFKFQPATPVGAGNCVTPSDLTGKPSRGRANGTVGAAGADRGVGDGLAGPRRVTRLGW